MNTRLLFTVKAAAILCLAASPIALFAQVGSYPTGIVGRYNSNSMTGCSYDPYTANATRTVVDITVAGVA